MRRHAAILVGIIAAASATVAQGSGAAQFRTKVAIALVDVAVVDGQGAPVPGLGAMDFDVTVGKRQCSIAAVDYREVTGGRLSPEVSTARTATPRAGVAAPPLLRSILFLIDDLSFKPTPAREIGLALERFLPLVEAGDLVGLATTSGLGPTIRPTTDRTSVLSAIPGLSGRRENITAPFFIGVDEAFGGEVRSFASGMVKRECEIVQVASCGDLVRSAARREAIAARYRTEQQMVAIEEAIKWLSALPGLRIVVMVSDGIAPNPREGLGDQLRSISEAAAAQGVKLYALTGIGDGSDVSDLTPERRSARTSERRFLNRGVQTVASAAGGDAFLVIGQPDRFLKRIVLETSGIYQLAVQLETGCDSAQEFLDVRVKVKRRGVTVRARPLAVRER